ncbi:hypothetical protein [Streptomyces sp. NPDC056061]|uniref:hypothetical protein n=1 Tax=Streptomyces sp. NPDC056061 TaxID=3345700 RepID=UPI0035DE3298
MPDFRREGPVRTAEPHDGWPGKEHPHTSEVTGGRPPSPGWTDEQKAAIDRLRQECLTLSETISTHPYWKELSGPDLVDARTALKHAHESDEA